jgi:membrane fusion protein (multidrug efflux system)
MIETTDRNRNQGNESGKKKPKTRFIAAAMLLVFVAAVGCWIFFSRDKVSTDNAYVAADVATVSSRVPGTIVAVHVDDDVPVAAGDVLVELDPSDYKAEVEKNRASIARIEAEIEEREVSVRLTAEQTAAQVAAAEAMVQASQERERQARLHVSELEQNRHAGQAEFNQAKRDFERFSNLYRDGAGSEQQRDKSNTAFLKARAQTEAIDAQIAAARAALAAARQEIDRAKAQLETAQAARLQTDIEKRKLAGLGARLAETRAVLEIAELNLSYTTIRAPLSGYIAQKAIQVGERVQPGQPLLAVVPLEDVYVEANFKETQLTDVRLGQPVEIKADIYPDLTFYGKVSGIRAGTGAAFSLLPPENATGNWIKVVQRVPVKIHFDPAPPPDAPLRVGLSLDVIISTADKSGARLIQVKRENARQSKLP